MEQQITFRLNNNESERLDRVQKIIEDNEGWSQSRSDVIRRLLAMAGNVILEAQEA
jgi:hypothetical protein